MGLSIVRMVLGPLQNNVYLLANEESQDVVIIDPSFEPEKQLAEIERRGWMLRQIWLTHGHYDHTTGVASILKTYKPQPLIGMHPDSFAWAGGQKNVVKFGRPIDPVPQVDIPFYQGQQLALNPYGGETAVEVSEVPGHNPGSVIFYCPSLKTAFTGDAVFRESIGRTDLPDGDFHTLITSIRSQVLTLPDNTTLLPGHGPESSVLHEKRYNPYLA
ncbi:MAG: MBL fold metallo-hydrolase [Anaerolineaceae bacterium]